MRWRRLLIALAVFAAIVAVIFALIPHEPKYEGRTLSEWIRVAAPRTADSETIKAIEAVRHIGTNGLPWLVKWIGAKPPADWKVKLTSATSKWPRWTRLRVLPRLLGIDSYNSQQRLALGGFSILGPEARPAAPELLRIAAASPQGGSLAWGVLGWFGAASVLPHALAALTNRANSIDLRVTAAIWVSRAAPRLETNTINSLMTQCIRENNRNWAEVAALMLAYRGAEPAVVIPYLTNRLSDPKWDTRLSAASALRGYHQGASNAVPALVNVLSDSNPLVQQIAADSLFDIDPDALEKAAPAKANEKRRLRVQPASNP